MIDIDPLESGMLDVGDGNRVYWESVGRGTKPAIVLHGGPGSGCSPWHRTLFDPSAYRVVLFDQRNCGRSRPHASEPDVDLSTNTTGHLIEDIERLREHLGIDRWLVLGGSWGSTLAMAYAETHTDRVTEMVLWGVTTGRRSETDWLFRGGVAPLVPEEWERARPGMAAADRNGDIVEVYARLLHDPDPEVRQRAALAWCTWESATPSCPPTTELDERFTDPAFALAFARLVTHFLRNDLFLEDDVLLRNVHLLGGIPGILVSGRFDLQAPLGNAWALHRVWPGAELVVVEDAGHAGEDPRISTQLVKAADGFADRR